MPVISQFYGIIITPFFLNYCAFSILYLYARGGKLMPRGRIGYIFILTCTEISIFHAESMRSGPLLCSERLK